jgi:hypothetical protein
MRTILLFMLFAGIAFSASCFQLDDTTGTVMLDQGTNIVLVVMLTSLLIAGSYMIGKTLNNPRYLVWAKDETYHLSFSLVLLLSIGAILVMSCFVMDLFYENLFQNMGTSTYGCYTPGKGINAVSSCYIKEAKRDANGIAEHYIDKYIEELMESTFSYTIQIPLLTSYTSTAGAYRRVVSNQYDIITNSFLIPSLMSISMQKLALDFINENVLRWILPSAFLLRVFIPTRNLGNILIALVVGLYVIVPFMYVFNWSMYENIMTIDDCTSSAKLQAAVCDNVVDSYDCANTCNNEYGFMAVARLIPQAFFLPNLTVAIFVTFMTGLGRALRVIG